MTLFILLTVRGEHSRVFHARRKTRKKKQHSKLKVKDLTCDQHETCVRLQGRSPEEVKG